MDLYQWMDLIRSEHGPKGSNVRLVLLTLVKWMNRNRTSAWPSQQLIASCCDLDRSTVTRALKSAEKQGWVLTSKHNCQGQAWKRNEYQIAIPESLSKTIETDKAGAPAHHVTQNDQELSAGSIQGGEVSIEGGAERSKGGAGNNTNSSSNTLRESFKEYIQTQNAIKNGFEEVSHINDKRSASRVIRPGSTKPALSGDQKHHAFNLAIEMGAKSPSDVLRFTGGTLTLLDAQMLWEKETISV